MIELPEPFGTLPQYVIPHPECFTIPRYIKGVKRIEVRVTWPEKNMRLIRGLYDYGFLRNDKVRINGVEIGSRDFIAAYLDQALEGKEHDLWGYALHVEVVGKKDDKKQKYIYDATHPLEWGRKAQGIMTAVSMSIGIQMLATDAIKTRGVFTAEGSDINPKAFFSELAKRGIKILERVL